MDLLHIDIGTSNHKHYLLRNGVVKEELVVPTSRDILEVIRTSRDFRNKICLLYTSPSPRD